MIKSMNFSKNIEKILFTFQGLDQKGRYQKLIELGRAQYLSEEYFKEEFLVPGCQSQLYLRSYRKDDRIYFEAKADALISSGLAALMILAYQGLTPTEILQNPPSFLKDLEIHQSLSPSRSHGLSQIHLTIKREAIHYLLEKEGLKK